MPWTSLPPLLLACSLFSPICLAGEDPETSPTPHWPSFRGPGARGISVGRDAATRWDVPKNEGIQWRRKIAGLGHSSPVIQGKRLYLTTAVRLEGESELSSLYGSEGYGAGDSVASEGPHSFRVLCLDKDTGEPLWEQEAHRGVPRVKRHPKASHASSTPACDEAGVVAFFGSEGLHAFDTEGEKQWSVDFGVLNVGAPGYEGDSYQWGFASSPLLYGDKVFVQCDSEGDSFVACLDRGTGEELWRQAREEDSTWCSPNVIETAAGESLLVLNGYQHIAGYQLDGTQVWRLRGGGDVPVPTPTAAYGMIYLTSAHGREAPLRALYDDAKGDLNSEEGADFFAWNHPRRGIYMQTPLVYDGLVYACSDGGVLGVYDALEGDPVYRERLGDGTSGYSGSAVACEGQLYFSSESGEVTVIQAGREFKKLATNDLGETCMSTPAISEGVLYFRSQGHLCAIAAPQ